MRLRDGVEDETAAPLRIAYREPGHRLQHVAGSVEALPVAGERGRELRDVAPRGGAEHRLFALVGRVEAATLEARRLAQVVDRRAGIAARPEDVEQRLLDVAGIELPRPHHPRAAWHVVDYSVNNAKSRDAVPSKRTGCNSRLPGAGHVRYGPRTAPGRSAGEPTPRRRRGPSGSPPRHASCPAAPRLASGRPGPGLRERRGLGRALDAGRRTRAVLALHLADARG